MAMSTAARAAYDRLASFAFLMDNDVALTAADADRYSDYLDALEGTCPCGAPATMGTGECLECRLGAFGSEWVREQEDAAIFGY